MKRTTCHCIFILLLFIQLVSCEKIIFHDSGDLLKDKITYDSFSKIMISSVFDVELFTDTVYSVEVEAFEAYIDYIHQTLDSGCVEIVDKNKLTWLPDYPRPTLKISFPKLDDHLHIMAPVKLITKDTLELPVLRIISLGKVGDIDINIHAVNFQLTTGSDNYGYYIIKGKTENSRIWLRGSSIVDAYELNTNYTYVYNNSVGDCWVDVNNKLIARLNTLGSVYYQGNPDEIEIIEESGEGKLINTED